MTKSSEAKLAYAREYRAKHGEKCRAACRAYHAAHKEELSAKARAYGKIYRATHKQQLSAKGKANWAARREYYSLRHKAYYESHKEQWKAYDYAHREQIRHKNIRRKYGLSPEQFNALWQSQGEVCSICKKPECDGRRPHVDHDHASGQVRSILCGRCNRALGLIDDDPQIALGMAEYLRRYARSAADN